MFTRFLVPINTFTRSISKRNYWIAPVEPTHDIVTTIADCQKWQLTYLVKKNYTNHLVGSTISMDTKKLLSCERFAKMKKDLEADKFSISIQKSQTIGGNAYGVKVDEFNKIITILI